MQVLTMERSAEVVTGVVTVEVLFPGMGSGIVLLNTFAVLVMLPLTLLLTVPRIRIVTVLLEVIVPTLYGLVHVLQVVPPLIEYWGLLILAGTASLTETPRASLGPLLCTVKVY